MQERNRNKLKADAARVADNESEDEVSIADPNESPEHRAKHKRIEKEDLETQAARAEEERRMNEARRERIRQNR